jgi:hypothetical protein
MISPGWPETTGNDLKWDFKESVSLGQEKVFDATPKINHKYYSFPQLPDICSIDTSETTAETRFRASCSPILAMGRPTKQASGLWKGQ